MNPTGSLAVEPRSIQFCEEWRWNDFQEDVFRKLCNGFVLHVCSGHSGIGDVCLDLYEPADVKGTMMALPFKNAAFDTVICDPPWQFFRGRWKKFAQFMFELERVARSRIILRIDNLYFNLKRWKSKVYLIRPNFGCMINLLIIYDREQTLMIGAQNAESKTSLR